MMTEDKGSRFEVQGSGFEVQCSAGIVEPTAHEIAFCLGITERAVRLRAQKENWISVAKKQRGGKQLRYVYHLLPEDVRCALSVKIADSKGLIPANPNNLPAVLPNDMPLVPEKARETGLAKYRLVHAYRKAVHNAAWGKKEEAAQAFLLAYNSGLLIPKIYENIGEMAIQTIRALDKKLTQNKDNCICLCDGRGGWKKHGTTKWRPRSLSPIAQKVFLKCYLNQNRPTINVSITASRYALESLGINETTSNDTFYRWLKEWGEKNAHIIAMARDGAKAYDDLFGPYIDRDSKLLNVGDCLVADGKVLNFSILHPATGKPCRMALIIWIDWRSRLPVGWQIMPTENSNAIAAALRMAILFLGMIPKIAYMDNGKAFKAKVFTDEKKDVDIMELTGLFARLGIAPTFALPYRGRSKINERFHQTMQDQGERMFPTFTGTSIEDKPAWMARNEKFHQAWHKAQTSGWVPNIREAAHLIGAYFTYYVSQPHSGLDGQTPLEVLEAGRGPGVDVQALNNEFLWRKEATPNRCRVHLYGIDYESDALHGIAHKVIVMYDTADMGTVWLYTPDGQYMDEAQAVQSIHPLASAFGDQLGLERVKYETARQNRLKKKTREQLIALGAGMEDLAGLDSLPYAQKAPVMHNVGGANNHSPLQSNNPLYPPLLRGNCGEPETMPDAEILRLETLADQALADEPEEEYAPNRPAFPGGDLDRYEWCFYSKYRDGYDLLPEDISFMNKYEASREYHDNHKERFEGLKELYAPSPSIRKAM